MNSHFGRVNGWIILGHLIILVVGRVSGLPYQDPGEGGWVTTHKGGKSVPDHASISSPFLNLCGAVCLAFALFLKKAISKCVGILLRVPLFMYELHIWSLYFLILWCSGRVGAGKKIRKALINNCPLFFFFFFNLAVCSAVNNHNLSAYHLSFLRSDPLSFEKCLSPYPVTHAHLIYSANRSCFHSHSDWLHLWTQESAHRWTFDSKTVFPQYGLLLNIKFHLVSILKYNQCFL